MEHQRFLTPDEENLIYLHSKSPEWRVEIKLIDNGIEQLRRQYQRVVLLEDNNKIASEVKGISFAINELTKYKESIRRIAKRVSRLKEKKNKEKENGKKEK